MFGLDDFLASFSDGSTLVLVIAVAILLGLRHATDPDHLAAVTTLIASTERRAGDAARLGLACRSSSTARTCRMPCSAPPRPRLDS
jgi:high-affinity nickel permease